MATREGVLARARERQSKPRPFDVPEWADDPIYIRVLSAKDQLALTDGIEAKDMMFKVLMACICNEDGTPFFEAEDETEFLPNEDAPIVMRVFTEAARVNGLSSAELEEYAAHLERARGEGNSSG
jgi:hypothetical protein